MDESEGVACVAVGADGGLSNAATINFYGGGEGTNVAPEERLSHFWYYVGGPDYHARDGD